MNRCVDVNVSSFDKSIFLVKNIAVGLDESADEFPHVVLVAVALDMGADGGRPLEDLVDSEFEGIVEHPGYELGQERGAELD